jgi:hypothetical protein
VRLYVKSQNVIGNVINQTALNPNVNWCVKIQIVFLKLIVVLVKEDQVFHQLSLSLKKQNQINNAVDVEENSEQDLEHQLRMVKL